MSNDKKYTQREVAVAVLKKAEEMLKGSTLAKAQNPDEKQDAKLGEDVEHLCEDHFKENAAAERKEGHKMVAKSECMKCNLVKPSKATGQGDTLRRPAKDAEWQMDKSEFSDLVEDFGKLEELTKSVKMKKVLGGVGSPSTPVGRPDMGSGAVIVKGEDEGKVGSKKIGYKPSELGSEEKDQEMPSDKAFEVEGKDHKSSDDPRQAHQPAPDNNPKEEAEGNNPQAGDTPAIADNGADGKNTKGHLKLAKFIGRMEHKRSLNKKAMV